MSFIVKNTTLPSLLDLLAPHSCRCCGHIGEILCECCKKDIISQHTNFCPNCKTETPTGECSKCNNLPQVFVVAERNGAIGKLIHDFKYNSVHALARPLAEIIHKTIPKNLDNKAVIIPLPTIDSHIRERGLDHTYLIAKNLAKIRHYTIRKILLRNKNSVQVGADRKTRLSQANSAYEISPKAQINKEITYILLDDVWTTGASMQTAIKKLRHAGARKIVVALLAVS